MVTSLLCKRGLFVDLHVNVSDWLIADNEQLYNVKQLNKTIGYEPADLTVYPSQNDRG